MNTIELGKTHSGRFIGNLEIRNEADAIKYAAVEEVTGDLSIDADASLPLLATLGGNLSIDADASLPLLTTVGRDLYIYADASLPLLATVGSYVNIHAEASLPLLATVGTDIHIYADASLPLLATVGSDLNIYADASLPLLTTLGGNLYIGAEASLPLLATVGGNLLAMKPIWVTGLQWPVSILDTTMMIGCQTHSLADWDGFSHRRIAAMDQGALRFWTDNKTKLLSMARNAGREFDAAKVAA